MHTLLDRHGNIPTFISITDGKTHDVNILDQVLPEAGAFYVMDRGYLISSVSTASRSAPPSKSCAPNPMSFSRAATLTPWIKAPASDPITPSF